MASPRKGRQTPTFDTVGTYVYSDGDEAVGLFGQYGTRFYKSQEYELRIFLARDESGEVSCRTICISKPRQNGKSFSARYYAVWMAFVEDKKVLYSAHHGKTVRKMFKFVSDFVQSNEDFRKLLKPGNQGVYKAQGMEGVYLASGALIEFSTRTNAGGRGETYDVIIVDEAQELTDEQLDALKPTTLASDSGDPQMIYLGTPPNEKCPGTVFRRYHDQAHSEDHEGIWWMEWAVDEIGDVRDPERWYETNPALGYRIKEKVIRDAAIGMRPESFAREYLGWWSSAATLAHVVSVNDWNRCRTDSPPSGGVLSCAVKFAPDGSEGAIAVCLKPDGGTPHVEVAQARSLSHGIGWARDWLLARRDKLALAVVDGLSAAAALTAELEREKYPKPGYAMAKSADVVAACSMLADAVKAGELTHFGQPDLDAAVTCCGKRRIGNAGGFGFESNDNGDATLAEAAALAYWAAMTTKRRPGRKLRVG